MSFLTDIKTIRDRARQEIESGAVTQDYSLDKEQVIKVLNEALATEIVCVLRYRFHYYMATGIHKEGAAAEFLEHSNDEQGHGICRRYIARRYASRRPRRRTYRDPDVPRDDQLFRR